MSSEQYTKTDSKADIIYGDNANPSYTQARHSSPETVVQAVGQQDPVGFVGVPFVDQRTGSPVVNVSAGVNDPQGLSQNSYTEGRNESPDYVSKDTWVTAMDLEEVVAERDTGSFAVQERGLPGNTTGTTQDEIVGLAQNKYSHQGTGVPATSASPSLIPDEISSEAANKYSSQSTGAQFGVQGLGSDNMVGSKKKRIFYDRNRKFGNEHQRHFTRRGSV